MKAAMTVAKVFILALIPSVFGVAHASNRVKVLDTLFFPGYGEVAANEACFDGNALQATIPASEREICDEMGMADNGLGYGYKVPRCVRSHWERVPEQHLVAPLEYMSEVCVRKETRDNGWGYPKEACVEYGQALVRQDLTYRVKLIPSDDFMSNRGAIETRAVSACR